VSAPSRYITKDRWEDLAIVGSLLKERSITDGGKNNVIPSAKGENTQGRGVDEGDGMWKKGRWFNKVESLIAQRIRATSEDVEESIGFV